MIDIKNGSNITENRNVTPTCAPPKEGPSPAQINVDQLTPQSNNPNIINRFRGNS